MKKPTYDKNIATNLNFHQKKGGKKVSIVSKSIQYKRGKKLKALSALTPKCVRYNIVHLILRVF